MPSFGALSARLAVVGLAPGMNGANRTGRPFTGDHAGDLLYATLAKFATSSGTYGASADDGFVLPDIRITNAVRCVPPKNKPETVEIRACNSYLRDELAAMPDLSVILALGKVAHDAVLRASGLKPSAFRFVHGAQYGLPNGRRFFDSYHCSRYNTNTGVLTVKMFEQVVKDALSALPRV